jgi:hypothetical protein
MTNNQQWTDQGAHRNRPPLVPPDLQAKAVVMKAEVETVMLVKETQVAAAVVAMKTMAATAMAGARTRTINNQQKAGGPQQQKQQWGQQ